jgi:mono/diheme cytochrome c family protein
LAELLDHIGSGLTAKRWIGRADAFAPDSVAIGAGGQSPRRVSLDIKQRRRLIRHRQRLKVHGRIIGRHRKPVIEAQLRCDPGHLRVLPPATGIGFELPGEIAHIEPREPRAPGPVAQPVDPMAGEACVGGTGMSAAERDQLAGLGESIGRGSFDPGACAQKACRHNEGSAKCPSFGQRHRDWGTSGRGCRFRNQTASMAKGGDLRTGHSILPLLLLAGACQPPPEDRQHMPTADSDRGRQAIMSAGCGACHTIPGIRWPQGKSAPALEGMAERALIAGQLPNDPQRLAEFIRDAPSVLPEATMPAMPLSKQESRDIAAYLYEVAD